MGDTFQVFKFNSNTIQSDFEIFKDGCYCLLGLLKEIVEFRVGLEDTRIITLTNIPDLIDYKEFEERYGIQITINNSLTLKGLVSKVEHARLPILIHFDELFGLTSFQIQVPQKYHNIIAGRNRKKLLKLMSRTKTMIYTPFVKDDTVHITGNPLDIQQVANEYVSLVQQYEPLIQQQKIAFRKYIHYEWIFKHQIEKVLKIGDDNGCFIEGYVNGTTAGFNIYGLEEGLINRAVKHIKRLLSDYYIASIQLANTFETPKEFEKYVKDATPTLIDIAKRHNVDLQIHKNIVEIYGLSQDTKLAFAQLTKTGWLKIKDTKLQIEVWKEHKDFIQGKKNGKLVRILKTYQVRVNFTDIPNDVNMCIDIYATQPQELLKGVEMMESELPSEISFYIPDQFHKRIIGIGGKNIQKIMKQFGVYVKFSNFEEWRAVGGYDENRDNVVCRTPRKNEKALEELKVAVLELCEMNESEESVEVPRQLWHWVLHLLGGLDEEGIEVKIPRCENGYDMITLQGSQERVLELKSQIQDCIPSVTHFTIAGGLEADPLQDFLDMVEECERNSGVVIRLSKKNNRCYMISPKQTPESYISDVKQRIRSFLSNGSSDTSLEHPKKPAELKREDSDDHSDSKEYSFTKAIDTGLGLFSTPSSVNNIRQLFEDSLPPGLGGSSSELRKSLPSRSHNMVYHLNQASFRNQFRWSCKTKSPSRFRKLG